MTTTVHPMSPSFREVRLTPTAADELRGLLSDVDDLLREDPETVPGLLRGFISKVRARRKTCFRCASVTIGKYAAKRGQRTFCGRACSAAQAHEDFIARQSGAPSAR